MAVNDRHVELGEFLEDALELAVVVYPRLDLLDHIRGHIDGVSFPLHRNGELMGGVIAALGGAQRPA
jgi:hypothetical protein